MADSTEAVDFATALNDFEFHRLESVLQTLANRLSNQEVSSYPLMADPKLGGCSRNDMKSGRDLMAVLLRSAIVDETNVHNLCLFFKLLRRFDLVNIVQYKERKLVKEDPLEDFLMRNEARKALEKCQEVDITKLTSRKRPQEDDQWELGPCTSTQEPKRQTRKRRKAAATAEELDKSDTTMLSASQPVDIRPRRTCDVRLRVRAEYCDHDRALEENVISNKVDPLERQFECFTQASNILRSRDLGYIVCDIKFSEITYLDAFWRDYLNGSLLDALKGVFITDSLKQAVGNEPIKLLVSVDEEDYKRGRLVLLENLDP